MRIGIIGAGHMGGWLAREFSASHEVAIFDLDAQKAKRSISEGEGGQQGAKSSANVRVLLELSQLAQFKPELLINAVSLQNTIAAFESALPHLPPECALGDVTSVKGGLADWYQKSKRKFVSVHPMFGPTFANVEKLENENAVVISESDAQLAEFFREFFRSRGVRIFEYGFEGHDRMMAYSLTLPFASTMEFAACMGKTAVPGTTFKKHLAIAKGLMSEDDSLLAEILFNVHSIKQIEAMTSRLELLKHIIMGRDMQEARKFFGKLRENVRSRE